jgi:ATP-dependent Clp protease ATP-binding subunit ClpC
MFESFTHPGRRALVLAQEEARALDHHYIGTEHILLGVIRGGDGVAAETLGALGVLLEPARDQVVKIIGRGEEPAGDLPFTPRAKKVLELSRGEAGELGASDVGPEHLLLGIVREGEGVAAQVLTRLDGCDARVLRRTG